MLARWLGLYDDLVLTNPNDAFADGGIKSAAYAEINPQLKMPTLVAANGLCVPESEVINAYLMDAASEGARRLATPKTIEGRTNGALATRTHDQYLVPIQGAMYRGPMDRATRATQLAEIARQLRILDEICGREDGDYVAGETKSAADAALFPTLIFCDFLLPKYFGWSEARRSVGRICVGCTRRSSATRTARRRTTKSEGVSRRGRARGDLKRLASSMTSRMFRFSGRFNCQLLILHAFSVRAARHG